ncbi:MAG: preprotein translocase subunit SecG [Christensenellaceae bacterium]|jgi:preprotein translocase subunit SecG
METLTLIIKIVLIVFSVFLIAVVLLQSGQRQGQGSVGGGAEAMFGKKKARGMDALLVRLTKIAAIGFMVLAVLLVIIQKYWTA